MSDKELKSALEEVIASMHEIDDVEESVETAERAFAW
jgi:hypothetical protein